MTTEADTREPWTDDPCPTCGGWHPVSLDCKPEALQNAAYVAIKDAMDAAVKRALLAHGEQVRAQADDLATEIRYSTRVAAERDALREALAGVLRLGHIQDDGLSLCRCTIHAKARAALTPDAQPGTAAAAT